MVTLAYNALSLELPSPDFGDTQDIAKTRILRKTRGGQREIFRDSIWPDTQIIRHSFSRISETKKDYFLSIVEASVGQVVTYTDHESTVWSGFITEHSTSQDTRGCGHTLSFTLEKE